MAKKFKCDPDEMPSWIKVAKNMMDIQPDSEKATVAQQKRAVETTINQPKGCVPRPKGGGGRSKEYGEFYRAVEKKTGKKWKDLF